MIPELSFPWGWQAHAACLDTPDDWWFPDRTGGTHAMYDQARAICQSCPVRHDCLRDAIRTEPARPDLRHGMRGGLTPDQRHNLTLLFPWWKEAA